MEAVGLLGGKMFPLSLMPQSPGVSFVCRLLSKQICPRPSVRAGVKI